MTVEDFDRAVAFCRDALGLAQLEDWSIISLNLLNDLTLTLGFAKIRLPTG